MPDSTAEASSADWVAFEPVPGDDEPVPADYISQVHELAPILARSAGEIDEYREIPFEIIDELAGRGFFRLLLPQSLGGAELLPPHYVPIIEELAKIDASIAWCVNQNSGCSMTAAYLGEEAATEIFSGPRGILAWGPGPGEARVVEGGYMVTARWAFASGSHHATWLGCHVPVYETDRTQRLNPDGTPTIQTMLFPKDKTEFTDIWHTIGLRGTGSDQYSVRELFVPEAFSVNALSRRDLPTREPGLLYKFSSLSMYAAGFGSTALGIASGTLDDFIVLARDKIPRGARGTMRDNNVTQSQVGRAEARIGSARMYLRRSLEDITEAVAERGHITLGERMTIRLASTHAIHTSLEVVDMLYQAAGSTAIFNVNPFERRFRDIHSVAQQLQGRQQHFETIGQYLMGLDPDISWL